jgi:GT2 family glycosyltransferase
VSRNYLHRIGHNLLKAEDYVVRYDRGERAVKLPTAIERMRVARTHMLCGMRMTFRRDVIARTRFEELLSRYAAYEDFDASLRASRHGILLTALQARVCHLKSGGGGRLSRRKTALMASLNWAVLLRLNSDDPRRAKREYRRRLLMNSLVDLVRDIARKRWDLPHFRGRVAGMIMLGSIFRHEPALLRSWYKGYQERAFTE